MRMTERLEIRLTEIDRAQLQAAAARRGWTPSFFIREVMREAVRRELAASKRRDADR